MKKRATERCEHCGQEMTKRARIVSALTVRRLSSFQVFHAVYGREPSHVEHSVIGRDLLVLMNAGVLARQRGQAIGDVWIWRRA